MTLRDRIMRSLDHAHACEKMTSLPETSHTRPSEFLIQKGPGDEASQICDGSLSKNDLYDVLILCTKFHAFIIKCTKPPFFGAKLLYYGRQ